ncbi:DUF4350 domain-containing protein [Erythrobacter sp. SDW2]|uniref:DUF4350 domain-containing protein n=1 Tax=Erythrobacter sp. SDW2 TaxID=2907154 RepID=UPI001F2CD1C4|nr:DUF4350 domain-containing protein [Erythrobacter sp. SDW2]UIP06774.1 DUF4350 domain-containing protein [Erythrobacter sp. SDW2]
MASAAFHARPAAFSKRSVLALVLVGTLAFLALLYFIGTDRMGGSENNGQAHAAAKGLTGYAALVRLLEEEGYQVSTSRSEAMLDEPALLVLTPPQWTNAEDLAELIEKRRAFGPTLVILPKWFTAPTDDEKAKPGWVVLGGAGADFWDLAINDKTIETRLTESKKAERRVWQTAGGSTGELPASTAVQYLDNNASLGSQPLVTSRGRVLAALFERGRGSADSAQDPSYIDENIGFERWRAAEREAWRVTVVAEPDLLNNWGMADAARARAALEIFESASGGQNLPIVFDLTTNGLGQSRNLLSLAFEPPFLAATLCLLVALLLVGWRAFRRFGPPLAEDFAFAFGKAQLVENGGGVIQRTGRMHLLTRPYAALVETRIAGKLGLKGGGRELLDVALARRGLEPVAPRLAALESARRTNDIIRAARALHSLERTITR